MTLALEDPWHFLFFQIPTVHSFTHSFTTPPSPPKGPHFAAKVTRRGTARRPLDLLDGDSDDADWFGKNLEHLMDLSRVAGSTAT